MSATNLCFRAPKEFRALGLRPKICGVQGLQDKNIGAPGLHNISVSGSRLHCDQIFRAPGIEIIGAPGSTAKISGLQGSKAPRDPSPSFGTLMFGMSADVETFRETKFPQQVILVCGPEEALFNSGNS